MIIDPSLTIRKIIETSLKREGIEFASYSDGKEALRALTEGRQAAPDLVILDVGLPNLDGYEVARLLKTKQECSHTIIIMLSRRDRVIDRLKARLAGAKDYITKPFKTQEIISVIHTHLGNAF